VTALLEVRGVSRFFGGLAALTDVSFTVEKGEILGLIGPNGAGKTTMFNVVNGFYPPSRGEVFFKGERISDLKPHQICQRGLARPFQVVRPLQRMSTLDNVVASAFLRSKTKAEALRTSEEILKFTGLWEERDMLSKGLPLGSRKRLEIARALATGPELLLLDEACAGLNPTELDESIEIIRKIKERGITIMISDRIVVLTYGQKLAEGTPAQISGNAEVIKAYLGDADED
jgi:branched-chain amino acid transport system ATP-binding protein